MGSKLAKKANFTKAFIDKLPLPSNNKAYDVYYDTKVSKLAVMVSPKGKKTFYIIMKYNGKTEKIRVGYYPDLTVENARKKAEKIIGNLANNINPHDAKRALRKELMFGEAYQWFVDEYAPSRKKQSSIDEDKALYARYLLEWKNKKLSEITKEVVTKKHTNLGKNTPYAANRMLALVSTIFNKTKNASKWDGINPCLGVEKFREQSRERVLLPKERKRFFAALDQYKSQTAKDCLMMLALTGQRVSNVMGMKWADVDLKDKVWIIAGKETKNKRVMIVPLTSRAFALVKKRVKLKKKGEVFVFPGKSPKGHFNRITGVFQFCLEKGDIKDLRPHDLRRTLGTSITENGGNAFITMQALGHENIQSATVYNKPSVDAVRSYMEAAQKGAFQTKISKTNTEDTEILDNESNSVMTPDNNESL